MASMCVLLGCRYVSTGAAAPASWDIVLGDSGMVSFAKFRRDVLFTSSDDIVLAFSRKLELDSVSAVSLLIRLLDKLDSPLWSRLNPMRPSFSIATKFVRTLESGLGEPLELAAVSQKHNQLVS